MRRLKQIVWGIAVAIVLLPLIAMQFSDEVHWSLGDFVFAGTVLFGSLGTFELATRKTGNGAYRAGVGLALGATVLLLWINGAVSITDSIADAMYYLAALMGIVGIIVALNRPRAGAWAMLATAAALVASCVTALVAGMVPNEYASALEVICLTGGYVVLYGGAAWLLAEADRARTPGAPADASTEG